MIYNTIYTGASYEVFAFFKATWPSGYTCTCTNGSKTLYSPDTTGSYAFAIPEAGVWTITCPGTSYSPKSKTIATEGLVYSATIS